MEDNQEKEHKITTSAEFKQAKKVKSKTYLLKLKPNVKFENNEMINVDVVSNVIEQYLKFYDSQKLTNLGMEKSHPEDAITSFNNFFEKINDSEFKIKYQQPKDLLDVVKNINNIVLFPKDKLANSITGDQIAYGTRNHPFISYGQYKIKDGYNPEKCVLVKNENSENTHKPEKIEIVVSPIEQQKELLQKHKLSFIVPFVPHKRNVVSSYSSHPGMHSIPQNRIAQYLINVDAPDNQESLKKGTGLLKDPNFRKALLYVADRKLLADKTQTLPTLSLMSDVARVCPNAPFYNATEDHKTNVYEMLKQDGLLNNNVSLSNWDVVNMLDNQQELLYGKAKEMVKTAYDSFVKEYYNNVAPSEPLEISLRYTPDVNGKIQTPLIKDNLNKLFKDSVGENKILIQERKLTLEAGATDQEQEVFLNENMDFFEPANFLGLESQNMDDPDTLVYALLPSSKEISLNLKEFRDYLTDKFSNETKNQPQWYTNILNGGEMEVLELNGKALKDFFSLEPSTTVEQAQEKLDLPIKAVSFNKIEENGYWHGDKDALIGLVSTSLLKTDATYDQKEKLFTKIVKELEKLRYSETFVVPLSNLKKFIVFDDKARDKDNCERLFSF